MTALEDLTSSFGREADSARQSADEWHRRAQLCVKARDDDLARQALVNWRDQLDRAAHLEALAEHGRATATKLRDFVDSLKARAGE